MAANPIWKDAYGLFGVGDYVTRDGTDIHRVISLSGPQADTGEFLCVVAPLCEAGGEPWTNVGEIEFNLTRRYNPVAFDRSLDTTLKEH